MNLILALFVALVIALVLFITILPIVELVIQCMTIVLNWGKKRHDQ